MQYIYPRKLTKIRLPSYIIEPYIKSATVQHFLKYYHEYLISIISFSRLGLDILYFCLNKKGMENNGYPVLPC